MSERQVTGAFDSGGTYVEEMNERSNIYPELEQIL